MLKRFFLFIIVLISSSNKLQSCDCKNISLIELQNISYFENDLIFIGKLINEEKGFLIFQIYECFKGKNRIQVKIIKKNCNFQSKQNSIYLIYSKKEDKSQNFIISECSLSRNIDNPQELFIYDLPPPPNNFENEKIDFKNQIYISSVLAKIELNNEVAQLRNKKNADSLFKYLVIIILTQIFLILLFVIFLFVIRYKKPF